MEKIKHALQHSARVLKDDVSMFRQLILKSEGGNLPPDILEKQALLKEIEDALARINQPKAAHS
ncbi:MAG: hypothetical protein ACKOE6_04985 [Flammeovirgaceae bacterium]